jgi:beta-lactamase class A
VLAYCARNLETGAELCAAERRAFPSFSTIKIVLALAFWRAAQRGALDPRQEIVVAPGCSVGGAGVLRGFRGAARIALADLVHLSLAVSDNDATNAIARAVGLAAVNELAAELGLRQTAMRRLMMDFAAAADRGLDNTTCAADLVDVLAEVATGARLGKEVTAPVLASLELQEHLDGLARYLPAGTTYAGKAGDDLPAGRFVHDCGILRDDASTVLVAVLTEDAGGYETISRLGAALYDALRA